MRKRSIPSRGRSAPRRERAPSRASRGDFLPKVVGVMVPIVVGVSMLALPIAYGNGTVLPDEDAPF